MQKSNVHTTEVKTLSINMIFNFLSPLVSWNYHPLILHFQINKNIGVHHSYSSLQCQGRPAGQWKLKKDVSLWEEKRRKEFKWPSIELKSIYQRRSFWAAFIQHDKTIGNCKFHLPLDYSPWLCCHLWRWGSLMPVGLKMSVQSLVL